MDALCLIAAPGAGAGELGQTLARCPDLAVHNRIFLPSRLKGLKPEGWVLLARLTGIRFGRTDDLALLAFVRERPAAWLDAIEAADQGKRLMVFSLTPDDLAAEGASAVLERPGVRVVMVMRKQIESYVASLAGEAAGTRVTLDIDLFEQWLGVQERWYAHWRAWLARRFLPCPVLRYETDIDQPADRVLRRAAAAAAQVGVTIRMPAALDATAARPPRRPLDESVDNWAGANREIFARGLERRAFGYPI